MNAVGFDAWLLPADSATPQAASIAAGGVALPDPVTSRLPLALITEDGGSRWRQVELPPGLVPYSERQ